MQIFTWLLGTFLWVCVSIGAILNWPESLSDFQDTGLVTVWLFGSLCYYKGLMEYCSDETET